MALVKGPFDLVWGGNTLVDVSDISLDFSQDTKEYTNTANQTYTVDAAIKSSVTLKLLASDVASLAVVLPQYFVPNGQKLSSGETVNDAAGAIDIVSASCNTNPVYNDLDIVSCGNPGQTFRLKHARTKIDSMEFADNAVRTVSVQFLGEPGQGIGNIQFFKEGAVLVVS